MRGQAISYRSQLLLASAILALGLVPGCGVLNPELIGSLGADPGRLSVDNSGHVVIVMNNLTPGVTQLNYDATINAGAGTTFNESSFLVVPSGYATAVLPCQVTSIALSTVTVDLSPSVTEPTTEEPDDDTTGDGTTTKAIRAMQDTGDGTDDGTGDGTDDGTGDDGDGEDADVFELQLAVDTFEGPSLVCGAVVFVNVTIDPTTQEPIATAQLVR